jgi:hypothetical protein
MKVLYVIRNTDLKGSVSLLDKKETMITYGQCSRFFHCGLAAIGYARLIESRSSRNPISPGLLKNR